MVRFLNLAEKANKHLKAETNMIGSIGRGEVAEILYADEATAEKRAKNLKQKLKGTELAAEIKVYGCSVKVKRI